MKTVSWKCVKKVLGPSSLWPRWPLIWDVLIGTKIDIGYCAKVYIEQLFSGMRSKHLTMVSHSMIIMTRNYDLLKLAETHLLTLTYSLSSDHAKTATIGTILTILCGNSCHDERELVCFALLMTIVSMTLNLLSVQAAETEIAGTRSPQGNKNVAPQCLLLPGK